LIFKPTTSVFQNTAADAVSEKSPPSLTYDDLQEERKKPSKDPVEHRIRLVEYHNAGL